MARGPVTDGPQPQIKSGLSPTGVFRHISNTRKYTPLRGKIQIRPERATALAREWSRPSGPAQTPFPPVRTPSPSTAILSEPRMVLSGRVEGPRTSSNHRDSSREFSRMPRSPRLGRSAQRGISRFPPALYQNDNQRLFLLIFRTHIDIFALYSLHGTGGGKCNSFETNGALRCNRRNGSNIPNSGGASASRRLYEGYDPDPFTERYFAVLRGYFDESYNNRIMTFGGWIAQEREWGKLERQWTDHIQKFSAKLPPSLPKITRYHTADSSSRRGEFNGWFVEMQVSFCSKLLKIIAKRRIFAIACGVVLADFAEVFPDNDDHQKQAYLLALKECMLRIGMVMARHAPKEKIVLFHDHKQIRPPRAGSVQCHEG